MTDRTSELEATVSRQKEEIERLKKEKAEAKKQAGRFESQLMNLKWSQNAAAEKQVASGGDSTRTIADLKATIERLEQEVKALTEEREKARTGAMSAKVTDELKATIERQEQEIKTLKAGPAKSAGDDGIKDDEIADLKAAVDSKQQVIKALQAEREEARQDAEKDARTIADLKSRVERMAAEIEALKKKPGASPSPPGEELEELAEEPHPELEELGAHPNPTVNDIRELQADLEPIDEVGPSGTETAKDNAPPPLIEPPSDSDRA